MIPAACADRPRPEVNLRSAQVARVRERARLCNGDSVLVFFFFFNNLIENSLDLFTLELKYNRRLIFQNKN